MASEIGPAGSDDGVKLSGSIDRWKMALTAIGAFVVGAYFTYFGIVVGLPATADPDKWGTFGDFFGGLMNPVVAFAAFYWLTQSVKLQKQELAETRHELKLAAEAQQQLVETGKVTVRIAALSALAQEAHNEYSQARAIGESIQRRRPGNDEPLFQEEYDRSHEDTHQGLNQRIRQANADRKLYLDELKQLLSQTESR